MGLAVFFWGVGAYNRLVRLKNAIANAFGQIDVQLKRRYDLIPNLVEVARKYLAHESQTLEAVIAARNQARTAEQTAAASPLNAGALGALGWRRADAGRCTGPAVRRGRFEGAYASEIFRAGILSIPKEQWEASYSIGLSSLKTYRLVVLPQAIRKILPPLTSQAVSLIKDSALVSTIAIYDLTMQGQIIISQTFLVFELWFTIAAIYLAVTMTLSLAVYYLEHRFKLIV